MNRFARCSATAVGIGIVATAAHAAGEGQVLGDDFLDIVKIGGPVMVVILLGSVIGLAFAFERLVALRRARLVPRHLIAKIRDAAASRDVTALEASVAEAREPIARIVRAGLARRAAGAFEVERVMEAAGASEAARLKRPVRPLSVLATIEPLLGLLGTILGMIATFNTLQGTSPAERVAKLAPGIGQALYTTAAGLCVAIPFVVLYHYLCGRVNRAAEEWEIVGADVVVALSPETSAPRSAQHSPAPTARDSAGAAGTMGAAEAARS